MVAWKKALVVALVAVVTAFSGFAQANVILTPEVIGELTDEGAVLPNAPQESQEQLENVTASNSRSTYPVAVYNVAPVPEIIRSGGTWFTVDYRYFLDRDPQRRWDGSFWWVEVGVFDLTGRQVAVVTGENCTQVWWAGGTLRNGAYIYRATVKDTWIGNVVTFGPFQDYVYIQR